MEVVTNIILVPAMLCRAQCVLIATHHDHLHHLLHIYNMCSIACHIIIE